MLELLTYLDTTKLGEHQFLGESACLELSETVLSLRNIWMNRGGFFTLGAAAYQDDQEAYKTLANLYNPVLEKSFTDLYSNLLAFLERHLGVAVSINRFDLAMPGFHIFGAESAGMMAQPHIDQPFNRVDFGTAWDRPFSFTVPLRLPEVGGGLEAWYYVSPEDLENFQNNDVLPPATYEPYRLGNLYIHNGLVLHRIANNQAIEPGEHRITLQGHGVHTEQGAVLYF